LDSLPKLAVGPPLAVTGGGTLPGFVVSAAGVVEAAVGLSGVVNGVINLASKNATGSYTVTFSTGKRYHGKGPETRGEASADRVSAEHADPAERVDWESAPNDREAFKAEARRIEEDGGVQNPDNYNKINSPGKRYLRQDEVPVPGSEP